MIETNLLLSAAFSIVASFSNVVSIPHGAVPTSPADLRKYALIGWSSIDLYLADRRGTEFWVRNGVVYRYSTPGSLYALQNPGALRGFVGPPAISAQQAVELATNTLEKLVRNRQMMTNTRPRLSPAQYFHGQKMPFYWITWPKTNPPERFGYPYYAFVEIDGRKGLITYLDLPDEAFANRPLGDRIQAEVYKPDPLPPVVRGKPRPPKPPCLSTNEAAGLIANWLSFCHRLGIEPGARTSVDSINWEGTFISTDATLCATSPEVVVRFQNGPCFESIGGTVFAHWDADALFGDGYAYRSAEQWRHFRGKIILDWHPLAHNLEKVLIQRFGVPESLLGRFSPIPEHKPPELGTYAIERLLVDWRDFPKTNGFVSIEETKSAFEAEFDLQTGRIKCFDVHDRAFFEAMAHSSSKLVAPGPTNK